jgi:two-component system nitrate/nitrite response regulator NarL
MAKASKQGRSRVRVLVGDPWPLFRDGLARIVKSRPDFQLVGAVEAHEFLGALADHRPDVALVDPTELHDEEHQEIFDRIRSDRLRIIFISDAPDHRVYEAISLGVLGYLSKDCKAGDICDAIAIAARGDDVPLTQASLNALAKEIRLRNRDDRPHLTKREREILTLLANGHNTPQIAKQIQLASSTIRTHLRNIYKKLNVKGQVGAVAVALRLGLIV